MFRFLIVLLCFGLSACKSPLTKNPVASSGTWEIIEVAGQPVLEKVQKFPNDTAAFIRIEQLGNGPIHIGGNSGCNNFGRVIDVRQSKSERYVVSSAMYCGEDIAVQETNIFNILSGHPKLLFDYDKKTMLVTAENSQTIVGKYIGVARPRLIGKWQLIELNKKPTVVKQDNPVVEVDISENLINATSQCIPFRWKYETTLDKLKMTPVEILDENSIPIAVCERELSNQEKNFASIFNSAASYTFNASGNLIISSKRESLVLKSQ